MAGKTASSGTTDKTVTSTAATSDPRRQAAGEGYEAGNAAPSDLYLDHDTGKVVKSEPERGRVLTRKGDPVTPWAAQFLDREGFKG